MPALLCPHCRGPIRSKPERAGRVITCPHCRRQLSVPSDTSQPAGLSIPDGKIHQEVILSNRPQSRPPTRFNSQPSKFQFGAAVAAGAAVVVILVILVAARSPKPTVATGPSTVKAPPTTHPQTEEIQERSITDDRRESSISTDIPNPQMPISDVQEPKEAIAKAAATTTALSPSLADLVEKVERSVVAIIVPMGERRGLGSGFVADRSGIVITNYHVVDGAASAEVRFIDGTRLHALGILFIDKQRDIAVLRTDPIDEGHPALPVEPKLPRKGEDVYAFGSPLGLSFSASDGIVSGIRTGDEVSEFFNEGPEERHKGTWVQTTAPLSHGNSGGPLVNSNGHVVGLSTLVGRFQSSGLRPENINFAISCIDIKDAIESASRRKSVPFAQAFPNRPSESRPSPSSSDNHSVGVVAVVQGTIRGIRLSEQLLKAESRSYEERMLANLRKQGYAVNSDPKSAGRVMLFLVTYSPSIGNGSTYKCNLWFVEKQYSDYRAEEPILLWSADFEGQLSGKVTGLRQIELNLDNCLRREFGARFRD